MQLCHTPFLYLSSFCFSTLEYYIDISIYVCVSVCVLDRSVEREKKVIE